MIGATKSTVHLADPEEEIVVETDGRDRRAFEQRGWMDLGMQRPTNVQEFIASHPETWIAWTAYNALTTRGGRDDLGKWKAYEQRVVAVVPDAATEEGVGDPTRPAASAG